MEIYLLVASIILCVMGILMVFGQPRFLIARYEAFQKFIRRKTISVDGERLSKFYSILFFVTGIPLLIGAIIGFINPEIFKEFSIWLVVAIAAIGFISILFCNISKRFIIPHEN